MIGVSKGDIFPLILSKGLKIEIPEIGLIINTYISSTNGLNADTSPLTVMLWPQYLNIKITQKVPRMQLPLLLNQVLVLYLLLYFSVQRDFPVAS